MKTKLESVFERILRESYIMCDNLLLYGIHYGVRYLYQVANGVVFRVNWREHLVETGKPLFTWERCGSLDSVRKAAEEWRWR